MEGGKYILEVNITELTDAEADAMEHAIAAIGMKYDVDIETTRRTTQCEEDISVI